jgi:integrase
VRGELARLTSIGTPIDARTVLARSFYPLRRKLGLKGLRFHDLRHSAISLLAVQGVPLRTAMEIAGHTMVSTTAEIYSHVASPELRGAANAIDRVFAS